MQNIYEIAKTSGIEIPEDKKTDFDKAMVENYKTIAEVDKINEKHAKELEPLQAKVATYETKLQSKPKLCNGL